MVGKPFYWIMKDRSRKTYPANWETIGWIQEDGVWYEMGKCLGFKIKGAVQTEKEPSLKLHEVGNMLNMLDAKG